jgi:gas vesicle protein
MRFIIGILLGFAVGFAGAVLFAPDKPKSRRLWGESEHDLAGAPVSDNGRGTARSAIESLRHRVDEAVAEARKASAEAEKDLRARYERMAGREPASKK